MLVYTLFQFKSNSYKILEIFVKQEIKNEKRPDNSLKNDYSMKLYKKNHKLYTL